MPSSPTAVPHAAEEQPRVGTWQLLAAVLVAVQGLVVLAFAVYYVIGAPRAFSTFNVLASAALFVVPERAALGGPRVAARTTVGPRASADLADPVPAGRLWPGAVWPLVHRRPACCELPCSSCGGFSATVPEQS
jgi:hypothetical protein